jgi:hypothetical protein
MNSYLDFTDPEKTDRKVIEDRIEAISLSNVCCCTQSCGTSESRYYPCCSVEHLAHIKPDHFKILTSIAITSNLIEQKGTRLAPHP